MVANIKRLAFLEDRAEPGTQRLLAQEPDIELVSILRARSETENWAMLQSVHGYQVPPRLSLFKPWFPEGDFVARCPQMLALCSSGAGYDYIEVGPCTEAGIIVCNQTGANSEGVAEHALCFILSLSRRVTLANQAIRRPAGPEGIDRALYTGNDILGKTVGIVGIGNIGRRLAELCGTLFKMTVLAADPYLSAEEVARRGATKVELPELLARADFVSVNCPLTDETEDMFGMAQFSAMKPGAYFINTARGQIVKEDELAAALEKKLIAGAGLDAFRKEPPDPALAVLKFENVIASPHIAGVTHESRANMAVYAAAQWVDIFAGRVPPRLVNPEAWPRYQDRFERILGRRPPDLSAWA